MKTVLSKVTTGNFSSMTELIYITPQRAGGTRSPKTDYMPGHHDECMEMKKKYIIFFIKSVHD